MVPPTPATPPAASAPATPWTAGVQFAAGPTQTGPTPRNLSYNSPQPPSANERENLANAVKALGREMDAKGILKELEWQTKINTVKEKSYGVVNTSSIRNDEKGSPCVNLLHSAAQFVGDPFNYAERQDYYIGFV